MFKKVKKDDFLHIKCIADDKGQWQKKANKVNGGNLTAYVISTLNKDSNEY